MVKGVIFDMDGLMFDTERLWDTLWEPTCRELGLPLPPDMENLRPAGAGWRGKTSAAMWRPTYPATRRSCWPRSGSWPTPALPRAYPAKGA